MAFWRSKILFRRRLETLPLAVWLNLWPERIQQMNVADKTVLITGSTDGVGKLVALRLAAAGARTLLHGRNQKKGEAVLRAIREETGNDKLEYFQADFSSLEELRRMAAEIQAKHDRLELLINNAGIGFTTRGEMERETGRDGYELRFAVNYLAPFLLTHLLLPLMRKSAPARIVNVASAGQYPIDFSDVMLTHGYDGVRAYRQSKLAQVMFTLDLALTLKGSGVTVNCLHPATFMNTNMVIESGVKPLSSVEEGADAILHLATSPDLEGKTGIYFDGKRPERANAQAYDDAARERLRELSMRLTNLSPPVFDLSEI
jgi:NAD(P)-dependent dehydrogenase (short-subunit alcohol dehydrogenase family)